MWTWQCRYYFSLDSSGNNPTEFFSCLFEDLTAKICAFESTLDMKTPFSVCKSISPSKFNSFNTADKNQKIVQFMTSREFFFFDQHSTQRCSYKRQFHPIFCVKGCKLVWCNAIIFSQFSCQIILQFWHDIATTRSIIDNNLLL